MYTLIISTAICILACSSYQKMNIKGLNFVAQPYAEIHYSDYRAKLALEHASTTGANSITIPITMYQDYKNSTRSYPAENPFLTLTGIHETPKEKEVADIIEEAKKLGLKVILQFQVLVNQPFYPTPREIGITFVEFMARKWFERYYENIEPYLKLAAKHEVDIVSLGHNFYRLGHFEYQWRDLAIKVRETYKGKLLYSAAFGDEDRQTGFWEHFDYIGVFPRFHTRTIAGLNEEVKEFVRSLSYMSKLWKKPVIVTRAALCEKIPSLQFTQGELFEAIHSAIKDLDYVEGVIFGDWVADILFGGEYNIDFSVQNRKTEDIIRNLFGGQKRTIEKPEGEINYEMACDCKDKLRANVE